MWETTGDGLFFSLLEEVLLWIMDSHFSQKQWFEVKNILMMDLFLLSSQDVNWWTGVVWIIYGLLWCFYQLFGLSFWRHPFTAEDPLMREWWNATFLQICSHEETNSHLGWPEGEHIFSKFSFFRWTIPLIYYTGNVTPTPPPTPQKNLNIFHISDV